MTNNAPRSEADDRPEPSKPEEPRTQPEPSLASDPAKPAPSSPKGRKPLFGT